MRLSIIVLIWESIALGQGTKATQDCEKVIDTLANREIYNSVDVQAKIIGGMDKLYSELAKIRLPKDPDIDQIKIVISFIVESSGEITELTTTSKVKSLTLDNELLQVLKKFKWEPGTCKGVKVPSKLMLKIVS